MLPTPHIITFVLMTLDTGHRSDTDSEAVIGAATLAMRIERGKASFSLSTYVLRPEEPAGDLLAWIDHQLADEQATLALYRPDRVALLLELLPGADMSPGVRSIKGQGVQPLIRMKIADHRGFLSFRDACAFSRISCASTDNIQRHAAWGRNDIDQIVADAEIDAIAGWRMALNAIERQNGLGAELATIMRRHLAEWLFDTDHPYVRFFQQRS